MLRTVLFAVVVAGCGDNAVAVDAAISIDAKTSIEIEVVHYDETPAPTIDLVFQDATGAVVLATKTDASGKLTIDPTMTPTISMVTAMAIGANGAGLETIMGIKPGDVLEMAVPDAAPSPPSTKIATLVGTFPANAPATTDTWKFDVICESTSGGVPISVMMDVYGGCQGSDVMLDIVATASRGTTPLAFSTTTVQVAASGNTNVTFSDGWRTDFATFQQTLVHAPPGTLAIRPTFALEVNGVDWYPTDNALIPGAADSVQYYDYPSGLAMGAHYGVEAHFGAPGSLLQEITDTIPATDARDLSVMLLPAITSTGVSATTTARPKAVWSTAGPMTDATFGTASLSWSTGGWFIIFPPTTASPVELPALPDALAAYRPPTDGSVSSSPSISFQSDSYDADYDAARQKHATIPKTYEWRDTENPF